MTATGDGDRDGIGAGEGAGPLTCLLVEDNPNDARLIRRYLGNTGTAFLPDVEVRHEETLEAAVAALDGDEIDLLLLDLGLPGTSGTDTFDRISDRTDGVPVIVLTGLDDEQAAVDLLQRGAQDYLNKGSMDEEELARSVRYAIERQEREDRLKETTEQLEVLNRILRHDIRNDLQALRGWNDSLIDQFEDGEVRNRLERIADTSDHILELIENSREYVRLVTDDDEVTLEAIRLDRVLREELQKAESIHPEADLRYGELPPVTVAANEMLSAVFRNLLNNAVQHHDGDAPTVEVGVEVDGDVVRTTVADDGPGVPDDRKEEVFGKGEHGLESSGTGIGLYLVQALVARFEGRVWIEDNDPSGAVFHVELETT